VNEIYCSDASGSPTHEWRVESRIGSRVILVNGEVRNTGPMLLLRCRSCGAIGTVGDPSSAELRRAAKPYRWFAVQRIGIVGRCEVIDREGLE
jgi:hypothetical protein